MSEVNEQNSQHLNPDYIVLNIGNVEIKSTNYSSPMEAMGHKKFTAYKWGEGLSKSPSELSNSLRALPFENASYTYGEYVENGKIRRHLFIEQPTPDGARTIAVIDADKSSPHSYQLENLYVVGQNGYTVDLIEELNPEVDCIYSPTLINACDSEAQIIMFGDLAKFSRLIGMRAGIVIFLHEMGHWYDSQMNPNAYRKYINEDRLVKYVAKISAQLRLIELQKNIPNKLKRYLSEFTSMVSSVGTEVLQLEDNASRYARAFMVSKRIQNVDLAPGLPEGLFSRALEYAISTYERGYLGRSREVPIDAGYKYNAPAKVDEKTQLQATIILLTEYLKKRNVKIGRKSKH